MTRGAMVEVIGSRAGERLLTLLESAESRRSNLLRVLTYHRIMDPLAFEQHMRHLASRYHVTPMGRCWTRSCTTGRFRPARS